MAPAAILVLYQQEPKSQAFIKCQLCTAKPFGDRQTVVHQSWPMLALQQVVGFPGVPQAGC